jgi:hypothetical protein
MTGFARHLSIPVAALAALVSACASAQPRQPRELRIAGSDTMLALAERWAQAFMRRNPGAVVHVEGGGTGAAEPRCYRRSRPGIGDLEARKGEVRHVSRREPQPMVKGGGGEQ